MKLRISTDAKSFKIEHMKKGMWRLWGCVNKETKQFTGHTGCRPYLKCKLFAEFQSDFKIADYKIQSIIVEVVV